MATITSNGTGGGDSNVGASWAGGIVPVSGDKVIVAAGDTITLAANHTWGDDPGSHTPGTTTTGSIEVNGTLKFSRAASVTLTCRGQLLVKNGGWLDMGSSSDPISNVAVIARLALNDSAVLANGKYGLELQDGGQWTGFGAVRKRWTKLATALTAGVSVSCDVEDATGWQVGDEIYFGSTQDYNSVPRLDKKTLTSVSGNTIGWSGAVTYAHAAGGHVVNATSNVQVGRANASYQTYMYCYHNAIGGTRRLDHVMFDRTGLNATNKLGLNVATTLANVTVQPWEQIDSCAFVEPESYGLYLGLVQLPFVNTNNAFVRMTVAAIGIQLTQCGDLGSIDDPVMMGIGNCIVLSGTPGCNELVINRPKITGGGSTAGFNVGIAMGWTIHDPEIGGLNYVFNASQPLCDITIRGGSVGAGVFGVNSFILNTPPGRWRTKLLFVDTLLQAANLYTGLLTSSKDSAFLIGNRDTDSNVQQAFHPNGTVSLDTTGGYGGGSCIKFEPTSATVALRREWFVSAANGASVTVAGFVKRSVDGITAKFTLSGLGITPVTQTISGAGSGAWQQFGLTVVQNSGGDGTLTLTIEVTGTTGNACVDSISAPSTTATDTGSMDFWSDGLPVKFVAANFVTQAALQAAMDAQGYTTARAGKLDSVTEIATLHGLDGANPLVVDNDANTRTAGAIQQNITTVGNVTTVQRV